MKKILSVISAAAIAVSGSAITALAQPEYSENSVFVSPAGNDSASGTIDDPLARYRESIKTVSIDKGRVVEASLTFNASLYKRVVAWIVTSENHSTIIDVKVNSLAEEQSTCHVCSLRDNDDATSVLCYHINESLELSSVYSAVIHYSIVSDAVLLSIFTNVYRGYILEP